MLAVQQRPQAMASGGHSDPHQNLPFGYSLEEFPFENAPDPPPGAPLLSDNEQKALNSFFEDMTSDNPLYGASAGGLMYSEGWMDLPPQFMGSASFFGHNPDPLRDASSAHEFLQDIFSDMPPLPPSLSMPPPPPPPPQATLQGPSSASRSNSSPALPTSISSAIGHNPSLALGVDPLLDQQPSADVLEAAHVLQNGSFGTRASSFHFDSRPSLGHHDAAGFALATGASRAASISTASPSALVSPLSHNGGLQLKTKRSPTSTAPRSHNADGQDAAGFSDMIFPPSAAATLPPSLSSMGMTNHRTELRWGSDQSFNQVQFTPMSEKETSEALLNQRMKSMECLEVSQSANTTRPSSPILDAGSNPLKLKTRTTSIAAHEEANGTAETAPPRKRRKGKGIKAEGTEQELQDEEEYGENDEVGGDEDDAPSSAAGKKGAGGKPRKRKAKASANGHQPSQSSASPPDVPSLSMSMSVNGDNLGSGSSASAGKRRRSTVQPKQPRENLTEEQKRENHIKSEQKRRTLIKGGFDDLCEIVPSLHGGGFSKSVMLSMAADWLDDLLKGNEKLREQLRQL